HVSLTFSHLFVSCFFFQAEDGIRDATVTGVQTCALPIYGRDQLADHAHARQDHNVNRRVRIEPEKMLEQERIAAEGGVEDADARSEERRVGKERRVGREEKSRKERNRDERSK